MYKFSFTSGKVHKGSSKTWRCSGDLWPSLPEVYNKPSGVGGPKVQGEILLMVQKSSDHQLGCIRPGK